MSGEKSLSKRTQRNVKERDSGSSFGKSIFDRSKIPEGVKFYKPKAGSCRVDIIPYIVGTDKHPNQLKKGDWDYTVYVWVHKSVGPADDSFLCLSKNYGKPCPICEEKARLDSEGQTEKAKELLPKQRAIYNLIDVGPDGSDDILLFEVSHFLFEKELCEEVEVESGDGETIEFSHPTKGKTVAFRATDATHKGRPYMKFKNFQLKDREPFDMKIVDETIPLDEILYVPTYQEVHDSFFGIETEESELEPEEQEGASPRRRRGEGDEPKPRRRRAPEPEDEPEDEPEGEPPRRQRSRSPEEAGGVKQECPSGHKFGDDCDKHKDCDTCETWDECSEVHDKG